MQIPEPPVSPAVLWRLSACARMAGVSPSVLAATIREDQIPGCSVVELGPRRIRHIRRPDVFYAWLSGNPRPADPLLATRKECK